MIMNGSYLPAEQLSAYVQRGMQGDEEACAALFHAFSPTILKLSLALLGNLEDAEEVTQDTFEYALRRLKNYSASRSSFNTWLFTIAISRCRNKQRRLWLHTVPLEDLTQEAGKDSSRTVELALERRGVRREMWRAMQSLPVGLREAVVLRYFGGLKYGEVGQALKCNPKTAESRVRLGLVALRRILMARGVEPEVGLAELGA